MMSRHVLTRRLGCRVLRDGGYVVISVEDVVPGDVVVLKPGNAYSDMIVQTIFWWTRELSRVKQHRCSRWRSMLPCEALLTVQ
jgi:hypothetical protein